MSETRNGQKIEKADGVKELVHLKFIEDKTTSWVGSAIECQTTGSISFSNAIQQAVGTKNEATTGGANWEESIDGQRSFSVPVGFLKTKKREDGEVQRKLSELMVNSASTESRFLLGQFGGAPEAPTFTGYAGYTLIQDYNEDYPLDNKVSATATLKGTGSCKKFEDASAADVNAFFGLTA